MVSEPVACLNDEPAEDDKIGEFEECGRVDKLRLKLMFMNLLMSILNKSK